MDVALRSVGSEHLKSLVSAVPAELEILGGTWTTMDSLPVLE